MLNLTLAEFSLKSFVLKIKSFIIFKIKLVKFNNFLQERTAGKEGKILKLTIILLVNGLVRRITFWTSTANHLLVNNV